MSFLGQLPEHCIQQGKGSYRIIPKDDGAGLLRESGRNQVAKWIKSMRIAEGTLVKYNQCINQFMEFFKWDVNSIGPDDCADFAESLLKSGYKPTTADKIVCIARQFFGWREKVSGAESPFKKIRGSLFRVSYEHTKDRALTEEEFTHFVNVNGECTPTYLVRLSFRTGMRLSDCCLLRFENIDFEQGLIQIVCHKTSTSGKKATIPLALDPTRPEYDVTKMLLEQKRKFDNREPSGSVFDWNYLGQNWVNPRVAGLYLRRKTSPAEAVLAAFKKAGLKNRSHHSSRHGFASMIVNSGLNTYTAKEILGITSDKTLSHYVKPDSKFYREAVSSALSQARRRSGGDAISSPLLAA